MCPDCWDDSCLAALPILAIATAYAEPTFINISYDVELNAAILGEVRSLKMGTWENSSDAQTKLSQNNSSSRDDAGGEGSSTAENYRCPADPAKGVARNRKYGSGMEPWGLHGASRGRWSLPGDPYGSGIDRHRARNGRRSLS